MTKRLENKVVLVTGGSSGIGRASALASAREGANVIIADVDTEGGKETLRLIKEIGAEAIFVKADVSIVADVDTLIKKAVETYGRLDCAFNNAGVEGTGVSTADYQEEDWDRLMRINLKGVWVCMKYEIRQMLRQKNGAIVNTSSIFGLVGSENKTAYAASKHGVIGLTKSAALEYVKAGIRINAICPSFIRTPMIERNIANKPGFEAYSLALSPAGRFGSPAEVAEAVVWLFSDAASFVTGFPMAVDGGFVAQ